MPLAYINRANVWRIPDRSFTISKGACELMSELVSWLVNRYFEPSQLQRIISGLKTNLSLSPSCSAHKSSNHSFSKIYKISPNTNLFTHTHTRARARAHFFRRISFFGIAPVKHTHTARTRWYRGPFRWWIYTRFSKVWTKNGQKQ